ncbi:MAG: hypothetical protein M3O71_05585 [Bacteroidota bacterium]|nr:hypothetical protein [Bacteroidota bacterium]
MTFKKAKTQITAIGSNLDGRMKYTYDLIKSNRVRLTMQDCISGKVRQLDFKLKKVAKRAIEVAFTCDGFRFNFPLKKNVGNMTFNLNDFSLLLKCGIKVDENSLNPELDLDVEF